MENEKKLKFYPKYTILFPIIMFISLIATFTRSISYYLKITDTPLNLFETAPDLGPILTIGIQVLLFIGIFTEEIYKKFISIQISASDEIIIFRFFKRYVLFPKEIESIKVDKLFTLGALPNEVIKIETKNNKKFIISKLYMGKYNRFRNYLLTRYNVDIL